MDDIKVIYKDKHYTFKKGITLLEVSKNFKEEFKHDILIGKVNIDIVPLNYILNDDCEIDFFDVTSVIGNKAYERSAMLILAKATFDVMGIDVRIEHSIDKGIYCVIDNLTKENTEAILNRMKEIVNANLPIEKFLMNRIQMMKYYEEINQKDKAQLLKYISNTHVTIYRLENTYDYMYGEMVLSTGYIKEFNLEYLDNNGCVLMIPTPYDNKVNSYSHHEKIFNSIMNYLNWAHNIGISNITDVNKMLSDGKWNDLIFMCEAFLNKELIDISNTILDNKNIKLVLISGPSCSGKTTTSKKLQLFLRAKGMNPVTISIDDYFKERDETPLDDDGNKDYESIRALDTDLFNEHLTKLLNNEEITMPTYNFITGKKEYKNKLKVPKNGILIIEGLHALNDELTKSIDMSMKYKIYISPLTCLNLDNHNRLNTTDNRIIRRLVRDNLRRGYNASETLESWGRVRSGETKYVFPYQDRADIVLNTSLIYEMSVLKVYAEPLLFSVSEADPHYREAIRLINILRMVLPMPETSIPSDSILREFIGNGCFDE